jgi:hypothetical protein
MSRSDGRKQDWGKSMENHTSAKKNKFSLRLKFRAGLNWRLQFPGAGMPPHAQRVPEKKVTACVVLWRLRMSQVPKYSSRPYNGCRNHLSINRCLPWRNILWTITVQGCTHMGMVQNKGSINQCVVIHIYILEQRSYANDLKYPFKNGIMFLTFTTSHESKRIQAPKLAEPRNRDDNPSTAWDFAFLIPHHSTSFHIQGLCSSPRFHALSQRFR